MITGGYFLRGIICLIIGMIYLAMGIYHFYYVKNNVEATKDNIEKQLIFGPNRILQLNILLYIMFLVLNVYLFGMFLLNWKDQEKMNKLIQEVCKK